MKLTQVNDTRGDELVMAVGLETAGGSWKLALQDGRRGKPALHTCKEQQAQARLEAAVQRIEQTKGKWGLPTGTRVVIVYEAGQEGFWIARALRALGYEVSVTDPASVAVSRQHRRAKTDRLDAIRLVNALRSWLRGERDVMRMVHLPPEEAEAQRHGTRERGQLQKEIHGHCDRIEKLLRTVGCWQKVAEGFGAERLEQLRCYDATPLPLPLRRRLERECARLALLRAQLSALEQSLFAELPAPLQARVRQLQELKAVGWVGALRLVLELFWRDFRNRREVGSCVGLVPQPYDTGNSHRDQGISKHGNARVRALAIQLAWMWLRYQPQSELSQWFKRRTQGSGANKRQRRIAIVAVARRLMISLWRYLEDAVVPAGALRKG